MQKKSSTPKASPKKPIKTSKSSPSAKVKPAKAKDPRPDDLELLLSDVPFEHRLGAALRRHRMRNKLTLAELSEGSGVSGAMLSRIENGITTASFDTLIRVSKALGVTLSSIFIELESVQGRAQLIKPSQQQEVVRTGTKEGHVYNLLAYDLGPRNVFEPFLITMFRGDVGYPRFRHSGMEFIYMLEGRLKYRYGEESYLLEPGDSFTFSSEVEHGPEEMLTDLVKFIDIKISQGKS